MQIRAVDIAPDASKAWKRKARDLFVVTVAAGEIEINGKPVPFAYTIGMFNRKRSIPAAVPTGAPRGYKKAMRERLDTARRLHDFDAQAHAATAASRAERGARAFEAALDRLPSEIGDWARPRPYFANFSRQMVSIFPEDQAVEKIAEYVQREHTASSPYYLDKSIAGALAEVWGDLNSRQGAALLHAIENGDVQGVAEAIAHTSASDETRRALTDAAKRNERPSRDG